MKKISEEELDNLMFVLEMVPDPRQRRGIRYKLSDLLLMLVYAALCGHSEGSEIAFYVELNEEYFRDLIG